MKTQNLQQKNGMLLTVSDPIKFLTKSIESSLCDYFDAHILVTANILVKWTIAAADDNPVQIKEPLAAATQEACKNCAPFEKRSTEITGILVDEANFINILMPMYNLIEYSYNYSNTSGSYWDFKRNNAVNNADVTNDNNAHSFKYKTSLITNTEGSRTKKGVKKSVPLKYLSNFWRSLEMPLINCKVELSLKWIKNCVLTTVPIGADANATGADGTTFKITDANLYVPIVTLSAEDNTKLSKLISEGF